ncbi:MAG: serine/threonine-protein kinase, partial [Peptidiphaga gingivicola]
MRRLGSRYILDERIGKGAQGEVWIGRASSEGSQDTVPEVYAFKILRTDLAEEPGFVERFIKERSTLLRVSSPYVIGVHDFVVEGTTLALVMDYVPGGDLRGYLKESGPLPPAEAAQLGASVAEGLSAVHNAGILHRDVKPANILLDFSTTPMTPRVVDFGIARIIDVAGASHLTGVIGTPLYMSPEVLSGEVPGTQADVYSLGIVLY